MATTKHKTKSGKRVSYSFEEVSGMVGRERSWVYRQVKKGRLKAITGFGASMIAATEIERVFGSIPDGAA